MIVDLPRKSIYLAGGFRSKWQELVTLRLADKYVFLDPSKHEIQNSSEYTKWDLDAITQSDIILAYMEASNPGGYSLALEVGYAKALGKKIIFVDKIESVLIGRYFEMVRQCADQVFSSLVDAVDYLEKLVDNNESLI